MNRTSLHLLRPLFLAFLLLPLLLMSCRKDDYAAGPDAVAQLQSSCDTLSFDTVFVSRGTVTKQLRIFNRGSADVCLSSVTLRGGRSSRFRLNVDGDTSLEARNVTIAAGDSIFIFVRANIDPNESTAPFLVEDAILLRSDDAVKAVPLRAFGRNAVYHVAQPGHWVSVIDCDHWDHTLPHVIIGNAAVDSLCTLTLLPGDEVYMGDAATLIVWNCATLRVQGSPARPVRFTSLRHDGWYDTLPGQWGSVWLSSGSRNNVIDHAIFENGTIALQVDTNVNANPTLAISNSRVVNMSVAALLGQTAYVIADNVLFANCGTATVALQYGGRYRFSRCTLANYWRYSARRSPQLILNNWYTSIDGATIRRDLVEAFFDRCIVYGSYTDTEVLLDCDPAAAFSVTFDHCLIKAHDYNVWHSNYGVVLLDCLWNQDPMFVDVSKSDFSLADDSPAHGLGFNNPFN